MRRYIALLHADREGGYGVSFPDFPGCITTGRDWEQATTAAADVLRFHVEGMLEDDEKLPEARSPEQLRADKETAQQLKGAIVTSVPLLPPKSRPERVNVVLDAALLRDVDAAAEQMGMNRSVFLSEAARQFLGGGTRLSAFNSPRMGEGASKRPSSSVALATHHGRGVWETGKRTLDLRGDEDHSPDTGMPRMYRSSVTGRASEGRHAPAGRKKGRS